MQSACSTFEAKDDPTRFYQLHHNEEKSPALVNKVLEPSVVLLPVHTPDYLDRENYISEGKGAEVIVYPFDRWIEPLSESIESRIAQGLRKHLQTGVEQFSNPSSEIPSIKVVVERFMCDKESAYVQLQVAKITPSGQVFSQLFYQEKALDSSGIEAQIATLSHLLDKSISEIADWLK